MKVVVGSLNILVDGLNCLWFLCGFKNMLKFLNDFKVFLFFDMGIEWLKFCVWVIKLLLFLCLGKDLFEFVGNLNIVELLIRVLYRWLMGIGVRI